jgi:hypothetical protein
MHHNKVMKAAIEKHGLGRANRAPLMAALLSVGNPNLESC